MKFGWVTVSATIGTATSQSGPDFQIGIAHHQLYVSPLLPLPPFSSMVVGPRIHASNFSSLQMTLLDVMLQRAIRSMRFLNRPSSSYGMRLLCKVAMVQKLLMRALKTFWKIARGCSVTSPCCLSVTSIRPCLSSSEVAGFRLLVLTCASQGCGTIS